MTDDMRALFAAVKAEVGALYPNGCGLVVSNRGQAALDDLDAALAHLSILEQMEVLEEAASMFPPIAPVAWLASCARGRN